MAIDLEKNKYLPGGGKNGFLHIHYPKKRISVCDVTCSLCCGEAYPKVVRMCLRIYRCYRLTRGVKRLLSPLLGASAPATDGVCAEPPALIQAAGSPEHMVPPEEV